MILFDQVIFGPIRSRRLGLSLGVNLLPTDAKICSFNCIYCECGFNTTMKQAQIPSRYLVKELLEKQLIKMGNENELPDTITFAGNGEPTLHSDFEGIIDDTIALRDKYCSNAKVSVLSNATRIDKVEIQRSLIKVDNNILKFDSAIETTMRTIDQPTSTKISVAWLIEKLKFFNGNLIIQTMFLKGEINGKIIDNTTDIEVDAWIKAILEINPKQVMIYSLDRDTPTDNLVKITTSQLETIANKARSLGLNVLVAS